MPKQDFVKYRESISNELISIKDRVRNFIGGKHWGEDGRYKETILKNIISRMLPEDIGIGTGFIVKDDEVSSQIDIIIYDNLHPVFFKEGDFVIVSSKQVLGVIEVKTRYNAENLKESLAKGEEIGKIIDNSNVFNGIFYFETNVNVKSLSGNNKEEFKKNKGFINNISFGKNLFCKFWIPENPNRRDGLPCFEFYEIKNLSFGYFISNLIESIFYLKNRMFDETFEKHLYPIPEGKEKHRQNECRIILN